MGTSVVAGKGVSNIFSAKSYLGYKSTFKKEELKHPRKARVNKRQNGESENEKSIMGNLLTTDEGVLPEPASILN